MIMMSSMIPFIRNQLLPFVAQDVLAHLFHVPGIIVSNPMDFEAFAASDASDSDAGPVEGEDADETPWWESMAAEGDDDMPISSTGGAPVADVGHDAAAPHASPVEPAPGHDAAEVSAGSDVCRPIVVVDRGGGTQAPRRGRPPAYLKLLSEIRAREEAAGNPSASSSRPAGPIVPADVLVHAPSPPRRDNIALDVVPHAVSGAGGELVLPHLGLATVAGYAVTPPLVLYFENRRKHLRDNPEAVDADRADLCLDFLQETRVQTMARTATSKGLNVEQYRLTVRRFWICWWLWLCARRADIEGAIVNSTRVAEVLHLFEEMRYDETPLRVKMREVFRQFFHSDPTGTDGDTTLAVIGSETVPISFTLEGTIATKKIVQTQHSFAILLKLANGSLLGVLAEWPR